MATTGIWKIEKRLDRVIDYITNKEKTINEKNYRDLHTSGESLDFNCEETYYVTGLNCAIDIAFKEMMMTKKEYNKIDGILGFHAFQSFKDGEVTPELAHTIGIKLAQEMWGDRFEVIVATHINTNHIHNHFVINSVSFKDGKKYSDNRTSYARLRQLSDSLCEEYGISFLKEKTLSSGINYLNYQKKYYQNSNYHTLAKQDLDRAIGMAYSYQDFENLMRRMGYDLIYRYGRLSIHREPFKSNIRVERFFGCNYSLQNIEKRIRETSLTRVPFIEAYNVYKRDRTISKSKAQKSKGLYGLYKYYCYILKVYPRFYPRKILSPSLRLEVDKMKSISQQTFLLSSKKIKTYEQLSKYKEYLLENIKKIYTRKCNLWIKYKRTRVPEEKDAMLNEINILTKQLMEAKKEVILCEGIEERSGVLEKNIKDFEIQNEREVDKNDKRRS